MKNKIALITLVFYTVSMVYGQTANEQWDSYIASYENGTPGSTTIRMDLIDDSPVSDFEHVLVTGLTYETSREDGFPEKKTFTLLHKVEDELTELIGRQTKVLLVGSFTHKKERLQYYYLTDPTGIKEKLEEFYTENYPDYEYYIHLKADSLWSYYTDFLYPNEDIKNYMGDQSVVANLEEAGDKLIKKRRVDHWLYFKTETDLKKCEAEVAQLDFTIEFSGTNKKSELPFELRIWRNDKVDINSIYPITTSLRKIAKINHGTYDGWETSVEK
ncbi:DUF695 domain-containing protein [Maribacter sp. 2307UL18-2]|uniref:DUF695 domain-containing protein n=1 Tax=Maribacter sp. 2307UL18-2 TaxID=3386274 RepID=UPI0039BC2218